MELSNLVLSVSGTLTVMLLAIIGFFLKQQINVIESLTESVNALKTSMEVIRNNETNLRLNYGMKHDSIDKRLDIHGDRLDKHEVSIAEMKVQITKKTRNYAKT